MRPLFSILLLTVALLLAPAAAQAYHIRMADGTNALVLAADETLPDETGIIGQELDIRGGAERDLWLAANSVRFSGTSAEDLRLLARSAVLSGTARQNVLAYAAGLQITTGAVVHGQAALFGNTVICEGQINGDAWILAQSATLGGQWGGTVRVQANEIRVTPNTVIAGDLIYASSKAPVLDSSVSIGGTVRPRTSLLPDAMGGAGTTLRNRLGLHGFLFLAALLVGMPFVGLFPLVAGSAVRNLQATPWRALVAGMITVMGGPFLIGFALMTVVGIPLALVLGATYIVLTYLSHIVIALWLGNRLVRTPGPQSFGQVLLGLAAGLFILYFAAALPGVASFIALPVIVLGTGALIRSRPQRALVAIPMPPSSKPLSKKPEPPPPPQA